jgi:uncharacterized protein with ParB-like and HNH nuclease domain
MDVRSWGILDFIKSSTQFVIPIYQRNYAWGSKQCDQIINDIDRAGGHDSISSHFTGSVVYIQQNNSASIGGAWLLIDGQQRLATIILILEAIRRKIGENKYAGLSAATIEQYYLINNLEQGENKYKLLLSENDKNTLLAILNETEDRLPKSEQSLNIIKNFEYFMKAINSENIERFCIGLAKLSIVGIALNRETDNPQLIFESMNSAGKSLSQADLIRNYVLMGLPQLEQEEYYKSFWRPTEKEFGQEAYEKDFDIFMRYYLTSKLYYLPKIGEVYDTFKFYMASKSIQARGILTDMKKNAEHYGVMFYGNKSEDAYINSDIAPIYFNIIHGLKQTVAIPVLLKLHKDYTIKEISGTEFKECLQVLENYLFRRLVIGAPTNVLNNLLAIMPSKIDNTNYLESFKYFFLSSDLFNRRFPDDQEFIEAFKTRVFYGTHFAKYTFDKLENYGFKEKTNTKGYTIEHIIPQNPYISKEWQLELGASYERIWEEYLHRIANLTLTGYNSEYSDKPFKEKLRVKTKSEGLAIGLAESPLRLNAFFRQVDKWGEPELQERTRILAERALVIWKKPTTSIPIDRVKQTKAIYDASILDLIETGYLTQGELLYSTNSKYPGTAILEGSGGLIYGGQTGLTASRAGDLCIHSYNTLVNSPNGWSFWGVKREGNIKTLEEIRGEYLEGSSGESI